jgi:hypothetical protein
MPLLSATQKRRNTKREEGEVAMMAAVGVNTPRQRKALPSLFLPCSMLLAQSVCNIQGVIKPTSLTHAVTLFEHVRISEH